MIELTSGKPSFFAVPFRDGKALKPISLPSGTLVEKPSPEQRRHAPEGIPAFLALDSEGRPHPGHPFDFEDDDFGEVFAGWTGVFLLPNGEVAIVYGAKAEDRETILPFRP